LGPEVNFSYASHQAVNEYKEAKALGVDTVPVLVGPVSYLDGSLPGDYGIDPLGLSDQEGTGPFIQPKWLANGQIINGRFDN
jgi:5-methyltetrahydropteroyltriglutamate--homocysteine methyltransferase